MANTKWEQRAHYIVSFKNGEVDTCNTHDPSTRTISYFWCEINKNILGACQCWEVLIFLWEPAGSGSLMMLREPHRFSNIHHFFGLMSSSQVVTFLVFSTLNPENSENRIWVLWENLSGSYIYIYMYTFESVLMTGSRSCENLRLVITFKSVNRFSLWEPGWEPGWESGQHLRTAQHWCLHLLIFSDFFY